MPQDKEYIAPYKIYKIGTRTTMFDISDPKPVFLQRDIFPSVDDVKRENVVLGLTVINKSGNIHFHHWLDTKTMLMLIECIKNTDKGDKQGNLPGFPDWKGSPDKAHPEWEVTSRKLGVRFLQEGRYGPSYSFDFSYTKGRTGQNGAVMPDSSVTATTGGMILPIYGETNKMPPFALQMANKVQQYLFGREAARQTIMGQSIRELRHYADGGDQTAKKELDDLMTSLFGRKSDRQEASQPSQQSSQQVSPAVDHSFNESEYDGLV